MCKKKSITNKLSLQTQLGFTYPKLHTGKSWYIDFMAYDPAVGELRRKKYMLDSIKSIKERRKRAAEYCEEILRQLRAGWSPWVENSANRGYVMIDDALRKYELWLEKQPKAKTRSSYMSRLNRLRHYIDSIIFKPKYVYQFDQKFISGFLDWLYLELEVSGRTRNNYRGWCSSLAAFFIERDYIKENPVAKIKPVSEESKKRKSLTAQMLKQMHSHLERHNPYLLLACMFEYYTFIRPSELVNIKLSDINLKEQKVMIKAAYSKNKRDGMVGLNVRIIHLMLDLNIFSHPDEFYLFGKGLRPNSEKETSEKFRREFNKMRNALRWSDCYQFYSLKDTGIRDLANSVGIVVARDQARHTDISTTNKYLSGNSLPVHNEAQNFIGDL